MFESRPATVMIDPAEGEPSIVGMTSLSADHVMYVGSPLQS